MITRLSKSILERAASVVKVDPDMYDVYLYGIEITLSSILNIVLIIFMGIIINNIVAAVCFLAYIIPLRQFCGGYHASTYFRCNAIFVLTFLVNYYIANIASRLGAGVEIFEAVLLLSLIPIIMFSPVKNPHKKLDSMKRKRCRIRGIVLSVILSLISLVICFVDSFYGSLLVMTQATVSVMIILEIFLQRRGIHES